LDKAVNLARKAQLHELNTRGESHGLEPFPPIRKKDPFGWIGPPGRNWFCDNHQVIKTKLYAYPGNDRREIEMTIRHVDCDYTFGSKGLFVDLEGLTRQEMNRNRVPTESIYDQYIEILSLSTRLFNLKNEATVPSANLYLALTLVKAGENPSITGEVDNGRGNLVEAKVIFWSRVGGDRSGAKSDHRDTRGPSLRSHTHQGCESRGPPEIARGSRFPGAIGVLRPVESCSVHHESHRILTFSSLYNTQHAEEVPFFADL
jgi:hypothetical protein